MSKRPTRSRNRPKEGDVRTQILQQATRLMAAHGFEGTSLKTIADAVGIRKASLLYHFASKDILRQSVLDQLLSHWNDVLPKLLKASTLTGEERFEALLGELVGFFQADTDRARLLLREMLDRPEDMQSYLSERVQPWIEVVSSTIRKGQRSGELRADIDPEAYLLQLIHQVISGFATMPGMHVLLVTEDVDAHQRYIQELARGARIRLFNEES